ncbi:mitochondrial dicarboxylate carrier-like [Branchiostoma lanceolatum]|uniref:SLC25A10 protein n=1 Tax=Branchiostoma lanceolatum TaxID=7740 RepID=A0A8J9VF02_BRALA|nr:SLC25A10 [Branchiostoma lanceolatum]
MTFLGFSDSEELKAKKIGRWYFGGVASAMAACCTHPLDLLKVHLQTQQQKEFGLLQMGVKVVKADGIVGLYNGITASVMRQLTYSMTRFAIYETAKQKLSEHSGGANLPFYQKVMLASLGGFCGGVVGTPADMVNVRMQNDMKLPPELRRNYRHVFHGWRCVVAEEGVKGLFSGVTMASSRAILVTVGQIAFYDQFKQMLLSTSFMKDNIVTHFTASFLAGGVATAMTQPVDVMKTRLMNAAPGQYSSILACAVDIGKVGPFGFFKGFVPAFVRLGPHTILTFIFFEQLRKNMGVLPAYTA